MAINAPDRAPDTELDDQPTSSPTPWANIIRLAIAGTLVMMLIVLWQAGDSARNPLTFVQPGDQGPSADLLRADFPDGAFLPDTGLDGQQFYAIARNPFDLHKAAQALDRPAYRLQRPLYSWLAWGLHPTGGGVGLIYAFIAVGMLASIGGGIAAGSLSTALGGRAWPALAFPLLPGSYMSLRVSVADALALALALGALSFAARKRNVPAVALAAAAAMTKETMLLILFGWALAHRTRRAAAPLVGATVVAALWAVWLRVQLPAADNEVNELVAPLSNIARAIEHWQSGSDGLGMVSTVAAVIVGVVAIARGRLRHPLSAIVALNLAFLAMLHWNVLALDFGGTRSTYPLAAFALVLLASTRATTGRTHPR